MRLSVPVVVAVVAFLAAPVPAQQGNKKPDATGISCTKDDLPILKANCSKCHDAKNKKDGFDISTYDSVKKGGKDGAGFTAGNTDKSPIVTSVSGDKPEMPKKADPVKKDQVELISRWVKEGAKNN